MLAELLNVVTSEEEMESSPWDHSFVDRPVQVNEFDKWK